MFPVEFVSHSRQRYAKFSYEVTGGSHRNHKGVIRYPSSTDSLGRRLQYFSCDIWSDVSSSSAWRLRDSHSASLGRAAVDVFQATVFSPHIWKLNFKFFLSLFPKWTPRCSCIVQCSGYLISSDHQLYRVTPLKTPFSLLIPLLQSQSHVTTITIISYAVTCLHNYNSTRS
jgi:hypothetical protein